MYNVPILPPYASLGAAPSKARVLITTIKRRLHYGWVIFGLTFANLTVEGGAKNVQGVFLVAFRGYFRSSLALTAAIFSASGLVGAFVAPLLGRFLDRFGPRAMFPIAACFILIGWIASSFSTHIWQVFIFYSVIATIGQTTISSFSATATLAPWFPRSKGIVLGTADSGNPTGQAIIVPLAQFLVSTIGWQAAFRIFGVAFFVVVALPNLLFQRRTPHQDPSLPAAPPALASSEPVTPETQAPDQPRPSVSLRATLRDPAVFLLLSARAVGSVGTQITIVHMLNFLFLSGYGQMQAAFAIGIAGLLGIGGRPGVGFLSDVLGREIVFTIFTAMSVASVMVVLFFGGAGVWWALVVFVALAGLSEGVNGLLVGAKAADLYPPHMLGTVMGILETGRGIGIATGPVMAGILFDLQGDYFLAFLISAALTSASVLLMWSVRLTSRQSRY